MSSIETIIGVYVTLEDSRIARIGQVWETFRDVPEDDRKALRGSILDGILSQDRSPKTASNEIGLALKMGPLVDEFGTHPHQYQSRMVKLLANAVESGAAPDVPAAYAVVVRDCQAMSLADIEKRTTPPALDAEEMIQKAIETIRQHADRACPDFCEIALSELTEILA